MNDEKQIDRLVAYFKSGECPRESYRVGMEFEHYVLDNATFKTVSFYGEKGVEESIKELEEKGYAQTTFNGYHLGAVKAPYDITTEPGAQFEMSIQAQSDISELDRLYREFMVEVLPTFEAKDQRLAAMGYHPVTKIDGITILPKKRYDYMYNYFKKHGTMSHNMMKGTCALQVAIDFTDEADCVRKYKLGSAISPILYAIFDNAPIFEGEPYPEYNLRQKIWENTDPQRSGVVPFAFDDNMGYRRYAEYILNLQVIFMDRDGELTNTGDALFRDVFDPDHDSDDVIYHAISIVFPDLRLKRYLEFRMTDAVPYPLNMSIAALIKGLFYSEEALCFLEDAFGAVDYPTFVKGREATQKEGLNAQYLNRSALEWGKLLVDQARRSLSTTEGAYLDAIAELLDIGMTQRGRFDRTWREKGFNAAIDLETIRIDGGNHV